MPAVGTITINDGQATPVAHNFNPSGPDDKGVYTFIDGSGGVALGSPIVTSSLRRNANNAKVVLAVKVPVLEEATGPNAAGYTPAARLAYVDAFRGEFTLPDRSTLADRKDLGAYVRNLLAHADIKALYENLEGQWG